MRIGVVLRVLGAVLVVATGLVVFGATTATQRAAADTPFTFVNETFNEATFPPTNWSTTDGTWSSNCSVVSPETGCAAEASVSGGSAGSSDLFFNPSVGIPANVQNLTLSFYSDFNPDVTNLGNNINIEQASQPGSTGDFNFLAFLEGGPSGNDATGTPVFHSIPLSSTNLPIKFHWQSAGDTSTTTTQTWAITNVVISGTVASPYALTANPISNTVYPHIVGGNQVTITLSGSSNPTGDALGFSISTPPMQGSLGPITQVDNTDATVVYTAPACANPNGNPAFICADPFDFTVHDAEGSVSSPAQVDLDVLPGGAHGALPTVTAPANESYTTLSQNGNLVQGADLTGAVTVGPSSYPDEIQLELQASTGTIDLINGVASGVTFANGTANNESLIYLQGSASKLNTALGEFLYFPPSGTTPTAAIHFFPTDMGPTGNFGGSGQGTEVTTTINGIVTNPPPSLAVPTGSLSTANDAGPLTFPAGATTGFFLTDGGATSTTQDEVLLSVSAGKLALPAADTSGSSQLVTAQGSGSTLDITGTVANINKALPDLTFDPSNLPSETVTLTASAQDPDTSLSSSPESIPITVIEAPFPFGAPSFSTLEGTPATVWLCGGGPPSDTLTFAITTDPTHGTLVADPSANAATSGCSPTNNVKAYTYTPGSGFTGTDGFVYSITDPTTGLESTNDSVAITVSAHQTPTAYNVSGFTTEDTAATVVLCGENPEPAVTPSLTFTITSGPSFGTLIDAGRPSLNPCNQGNVAEDFTYTPSAGTFKTDGTDSFTYVVSNGTVSSPATGTITVTTLTPQVVGYSAIVNEDSSIGLNLCSTAQTVHSPTFTIVQPPVHGTLDQNPATTNGPGCPTGYFNFGYERYVPTALFSGTDQIGYTATEDGRTSTEVFIDLTVQKIEIPPTATPQTVTDIAPQPVVITLAGSSLQGSPLTFDVVNGPQHGTLSGTSPNVVYTPSSASFAGTDSFTFVANDGVADSAPATVTINIAVPQLASSVCYAGTPINLGNGDYNCAGSLTALPSGFGAIELAHTSGVANAELALQDTITNESSASDTVTLTAPAGTSQWPLFYDVQGSDQTAALTGPGLQVTLGPAGSGTAKVDVLIVVFAPLTLPAPPTTLTHVLAVSGNLSSVSTQVPVEIQDGTSTATLSLAQSNGSGAVSFPTGLVVSPPLFNNGPAGGVDIEAGLSGTGINTFSIHATVQPGSTSGVTPSFFLGTTNVTSAVLAGTEVITCYAGVVSCPPMSATLTPGTGSGFFSMEITIASTIDGQGTQAFASVELAGAVGPDLYTTNPNIGASVYETTPVTQTIAKPTELSGSATQGVFLANAGDVSDTFTLQAAVTLDSGDSSAISIGATAPAIYGQEGAPTDVTRSATGSGGYTVTIPVGDVVEFFVTDTAGPSAANDPPQVILTAASHLDPAKVDSFKVTFPTYDYRPDAVLTGPDGFQIGAAEYQQTYLGPVGNNQQAEYNVDQSQAANINVTLADRGDGSQPTGDSVVVTAPNMDSNFDVTYTLLQNGTSTDVTTAITTSGLSLTLSRPGGPMPVIRMTALASVTAQAGHPGYYPLIVTSQNSLPSGLADVVVIGLYDQGQSQLRFAGLPQPEPADITRTVQQDGYTNRVAPMPDAGYGPGATYGAYSDPTGQKFAYVSGYDTFDLQVASEIVTHTAYRIQLVDPGAQLVGLPGWERDVFGQPYYNGRNLDVPGDPLAAGSGLGMTITAGGHDITAAVENGTYTTASLGTNDTSDITVTFSSTTQLRYIPLKFNLIDATNGEIEDVMVVEPSSIVTCTPDGYQQVQQTITTSTGSHKLNFEAYDRTDPQSPAACMQHLSHSWITSAPLVFGQYIPATSSNTGDTPAGGDNPVGLWLMPQPNTILRVNTDTGYVNGNANVFVDSPLTDASGNPDANTSSDGLENYYFVGAFTDVNWDTTEGTNGIPVVAGHSLLPAAPFPLVQPDQANWPSNTMYAQRYFQVDGLTGAPVMVGEMDVHIPWFNGDIPLIMELDGTQGLILNYPAPPNTESSVPITGTPGTINFYLEYWNVTNNGTVTQGGCLGLPSAFYTVLGDALGIPGAAGPNICILGATVTFEPVNPTPGAETGVSQITVQLMNVYQKNIKENPEFNLSSFYGEIDMDPANGEQVKKVVIDPVFGIGPPTPCQVTQNNGLATGALNFFLYLPCPTNYFFYNAKITYQAGGFDTGYSNPGSVGLQFSGTLTFLNVVQLANVEADISTNPFNFHFADSPIDLSISNSIPVSAQVTFSGDVGANGFSIDVSGSIIVAGVTIDGVSGVVSTKGMGVCGTLGGLSVGVAVPWGAPPTVYPSGCTTSQFDVGT